MTYKYTPEELMEMIKMYHTDVEERRNEFPDEAGLLNVLNISDEEYAAMNADNDYEAPLRWAKRRRKSYLERQMVKDNKKATGCLNALKQPQNGGYQDKPEVNRVKKIVVKLEGIADK
jgi:hypothetical protein